MIFTKLMENIFDNFSICIKYFIYYRTKLKTKLFIPF